jgi:hypothetical protein
MSRGWKKKFKFMSEDIDPKIQELYTRQQDILAQAALHGVTVLGGQQTANPLAEAERNQLLADNAQLRRELLNTRLEMMGQQQRIEQLKSIAYAHAFISKPGSLTSISREILELIKEFHPDKNPSGVDATKITQALTELRSRYSKKS